MSASAPPTKSLTMDSFEPISIVRELGMPELVLGGLSESWLLKQCGDQHWRLLARLCGSSPEALADSLGNRLYPSVLACSLGGGGLHSFAEGAKVTITSRMEVVHLSRAVSLHEIVQNRPDAGVAVTILSQLVRRVDSNARLVRGDTNSTQLPPEFGDMAAHALHQERMKASAEALSASHSAPEVSAVFEPCPSADFNGVGLFYFAQYPEVVDRMEWSCRRALRCTPVATLSRSTFYYGNLDPGDSVRIELRDVSVSAEGLLHVARVFRQIDDALICQATTRKICKSE
jgi:probable biosynthetic protein (TIGR04098 family)